MEFIMNFPLTKCVKLNCDTKIAKESGKCEFFAAETNLISSTTSKEANFRPQNWFDSCVYSIVSVLFHFMDIFEPGLPNKKNKKILVSK